MQLADTHIEDSFMDVSKESVEGRRGQLEARSREHEVCALVGSRADSSAKIRDSLRSRPLSDGPTVNTAEQS